MELWLFEGMKVDEVRDSCPLDLQFQGVTLGASPPTHPTPIRPTRWPASKPNNPGRGERLLRFRAITNCYRQLDDISEVSIILLFFATFPHDFTNS